MEHGNEWLISDSASAEPEDQSDSIWRGEWGYWDLQLPDDSQPKSRKVYPVANVGTFLNYPWPYFSTAALAALMILYVYRQPHRPGARQFIWLVAVYVVWALAGGFSTILYAIQVLYVLFVLQSVCSLVVTALELRVVLEYTGNEKWIARGSLLFLFIPPLLLAGFALAFPNEFARVEYRSGMVVLFGQPVMKWGVFAYVAIVFAICFAILLTCLIRAPAFWAPLLLLAVGAIFPVIGFAMIRPQWVSVPPIQLSILLTNVTMLTYFVALYGFRFLQVIPVARDMLISGMPYGLLVLDSEDHLVDFNPAAQSLPGLPEKLVRQRAASRALGSWWNRLAPLIDTKLFSQDFTVGELILHVTSLPLLQASGWRLGQMFLIEDVTQTRQAQLRQQETQRSLATLEERERLARELHDSLGQTLAAAHLQANSARLFLTKGEVAEADRCLEQIANMTIASEVDVREYLLGAKIAFSPDNRFFESLRRYVVQFSRQYGLPVELIVPPPLEGHGLAAAAEVQLIRIIQEALSNIRKHARAKSVQVVFTDSEQLVQIAIIDDGLGFDPAAVAAQQAEGFGLYSMRERAEALDGRLEVISHPGQGTQVLIKLHAKDGYKGGEVEK